MDTFLSKSYSPKVTVVCLTYNQEKYILDAMKGFSMQETTFPYVCVVMDDASTDGEQNIIRTYLQSEFEMDNAEHVSIPESEVMVCRHRNNPNCYFAVYLLKKNLWHTGKKDPLIDYWKQQSEYIALCEGDDYWTDPMKLQKQVDFLESHQDYSMCFHSASILNEGVNVSNVGALCEFIEEKEYTSDEMFSAWIVPTASIVYRRNVVEQYGVKHFDWITRGDICLVLRCSHTGRVWGMNKRMSIYRMQPNSVSHNPIYRGKEYVNLPKHFRCLYINFPQLNKNDITYCISHAYYSKMKYETGIYNKVADFILFCYWNPKYACKKIVSVLFK